MTIIGGADGPTSIFITGSFGWLNWFGLIIIALLLVPNALWAIKHKDERNQCQSKTMNLLEQLGRYGCMFLMVFNIGVAELGFASAEAFVVYLLGNAALLLLYWAFWIVFSKKPGMRPALALAILPTLIFLLCGVTMRHWLLVGCGVLFCIAHIYVTVCNAKEQ